MSLKKSVEGNEKIIESYLQKWDGNFCDIPYFCYFLFYYFCPYMGDISMTRINVGKNGLALLANTRDVLSGTGYKVEVMILHYHLTFYSELECKITARYKVSLSAGNRRLLIEAKTPYDIMAIFGCSNSNDLPF